MNDEQITIREIAQKAVKMGKKYGVSYKLIDAIMDITACHEKAQPLRLKELLAADESTFCHDVFGIRKHLNRTDLKLEDCFLPRFSRNS